MSKPKPYISRADTLQDALAAVAKLPGILAEAIGRWGSIEIVVRKREKKRSVDQNRLGRLWCKQAGEQGDMTAEECRGYCKLHFAVPIMRRDSDEYREAYDRIIKPLPYEQKLEMMQVPLDFPATRAMNKAQKSEYLDACWQHLTGLGFRLTDPGLKGMDQYREDQPCDTRSGDVT